MPCLHRNRAKFTGFTVFFKLNFSLATKRAKPNGISVVNSDEIDSFIADCGISDLPGVGWSISSKLESQGITTCRQLRLVEIAILKRDYGPKLGVKLYNFCRGIDERILKTSRTQQQIGAEVNWAVRFENEAQLKDFIEKLCREVSGRLKAAKFMAKKLSLKVMQRCKDAGEPRKFMGHGICDTHQRSSPINLTDESSLIFQEAWKLIKGLHIPCQEIRGIGIHLSKLEFATKIEERIGVLEMLKKNDAVVVETDHEPFQIDESILIELPQKLQNEVLEQILVSRNRAEDIPFSPKSPVAARPRKSPLSNKKKLFVSPSKAKRKFAEVNNFSTLTQSWAIMPTEKMLDMDIQVFENLPKELRLEVIKEKKLEIRRKDNLLEEIRDAEVLKKMENSCNQLEIISKIRASFAASTRFTEWRRLILEWTELAIIEDDDLQYFLGFLNMLVDLSMLDKARKVATLFLKATEGKKAWIRKRTAVINQFQQKVSLKYGFFLDLDGFKI